MISECISDDIPFQLKVLNIFIPIQMHFYSLLSNWRIASHIKPHKGICHSTKCDVFNDFKLFQTVYHRIYCGNFLTLSNQMLHNKSKCIRITDICKSCPSRGILTSQIYLLTLFAKNKILAKNLRIYSYPEKAKCLVFCLFCLC